MHAAFPELKGRSLQETIVVPSFLKVTVPPGTPAGDVTAAEKVKLCPGSLEEEISVVVDALAIWNERATSVAGSWFESPPCEAVIVHSPAPLMCTLDPDVLHWPNAAKLTGRPEEADALTMKSASPKVLPGRASKVIVCAACCAVTVSVTCGAALWLASPAWSYFTVQLPVPAMVNAAPLFVQAPALLYETARPEDDVAATLNCVLLAALAGACVVTLIVWLALRLFKLKAVESEPELMLAMTV
jgi:hypothetical protein